MCRDREEGEWAGGEGGEREERGKKGEKIGAKVLVILYIQKGKGHFVHHCYSSTV